jgi:hypothetical protein
MKKDYLTPLAIVVGAIIISVGIYLGLTSKDRKAFNECVKYYTEFDPGMSELQIKVLCNRTTK